MLLNMFRRAKPQTTSNKMIGCHGNSSDEEEESSALIAQSARFTVSETYVVPDINGHFPTDLSDSDDDFFEKTCPTCQQPLEGAKECGKCDSSVKRKANEREPSSHHKQTDTQTHRHTKNSDNSDKITRTTKTYTEEELKTAKQLQKISLELQKSASADT